MHITFLKEPFLLKQILLLSFCILSAFPLSGQEVVQLIITSTKTTDRAFHKKEDSFLEVRGERHQLTYTLDTPNQKLKTRKYSIDTYYSLQDIDTLIKVKTKKRYKLWRNEINLSDFNDLLSCFQTDIDTLEKNDFAQHISHYYVHFYVDIIQGQDTLSLHKSLPFDKGTAWNGNVLEGSVLNPSIDEQIYALLPKRFLIREKLLGISMY